MALPLQSVHLLKITHCTSLIEMIEIWLSFMIDFVSDVQEHEEEEFKIQYTTIYFIYIFI